MSRHTGNHLPGGEETAVAIVIILSELLRRLQEAHALHNLFAGEKRVPEGKVTLEGFCSDAVREQVADGYQLRRRGLVEAIVGEVFPDGVVEVDFAARLEQRQGSAGKELGVGG